MFEKPSEWSYKEALCAAEFPKIAKDTQEVTDVINLAFSSKKHSQKESIIFPYGGDSSICLTRSRILQFRGEDGLNFDLDCSPEGIFNILKEGFMFRNGFLSCESKKRYDYAFKTTLLMTLKLYLED